jgi:hypothetical protein
MDSPRHAFLADVNERSRKIGEQIDSFSSTGKRVAFLDREAIELYRHIESSLPDRDEDTSNALASLERRSSFLGELLLGNDLRAQEFQLRFDDRLIQTTELRVKAATGISSYLEKLAILGMGSFGLSITLFGFLLSHATGNNAPRAITLAIISWTLILGSIVVATKGQLELTVMCHQLLHFHSDEIGARLKRESADAYNQIDDESKIASTSTSDSTRLLSSQKSAIWTQSAEYSRKALYSTTLVAFGLLFLLLFIAVNSALLAAPPAK